MSGSLRGGSTQMHTGSYPADVRGTAGPRSPALGERPLVLEVRVPMVMERRKRLLEGLR
ncbi:hypothetical protein ACWEKJ_10535 [Amycolatopsis thermoflava]